MISKTPRTATVRRTRSSFVTRIKVVLCAILLSLPALLVAATPTEQPFSFSWSAVPGAGGYLIEVAALDGNVVLTQKLEGNIVQTTIRLPPGPYKLRLTSLNRFLRSEASSDWASIRVLPAKAPVIVSITPSVLLTESPQSVTVKGDNLATDATLTITTPGGIPLQVPMRRVSQTEISAAIPSLLEAGTYSVELKNPPDMVSEVKGNFTINFPAVTLESISPDSFVEGDKAEKITLKGSNFSPRAKLLLTGTDGKDLEIAVASKKSDTISATLPDGLAPGNYSLQLINEPGSQTPAPVSKQIAVSARIVVKPPVFVSLAPNVFSPDDLTTLSVKVDNFDANAKAIIRSPLNADIEAPIERTSANELSIKLPQLADTGDYSLVLTNPPNVATEVPAAFKVAYPIPVLNKAEPASITLGSDKEQVVLNGKDFSSRIVVLVKKRNLGNDAAAVELPIVDRKSDSLTVSIPQDIEPGDYDLSVVNGPNETAVALPSHFISILPAPVPAPKILVTAGWSSGTPTGMWADIYRATPASFFLRGDMFVTKGEIPKKDSVFDFMVGVDTRMIFLESRTDASYVDTKLSILSVAAVPALMWSLPFMSVTLHAGIGVAYSNLEYNDTSPGGTGIGAGTEASLDVYNMGVLDVEIPIGDVVRVGASFNFQHYFMTKDLDILTGSLYTGIRF